MSGDVFSTAEKDQAAGANFVLTENLAATQWTGKDRAAFKEWNGPPTQSPQGLSVPHLVVFLETCAL